MRLVRPPAFMPASHAAPAGGRPVPMIRGLDWFRLMEAR